MTTSELLTAAKARLTPATWSQNFFQGQHECPLLALERARCHARHHQYGMEEDAQRYLLVCIGGDHLYSVPQWNDAPGRTLAEVHALFDQAIALALAEEATTAPVAEPELINA